MGGRLGQGRQCLAQAVFSLRELLTHTGDIVKRWKEQLLNPTNASSVESEDSGEVLGSQEPPQYLGVGSRLTFAVRC